MKYGKIKDLPDVGKVFFLFYFYCSYSMLQNGIYQFIS